MCVVVCLLFVCFGLLLYDVGWHFGDILVVFAVVGCCRLVFVVVLSRAVCWC